MKTEHDFEPLSRFCRRCGASCEAVVDRDLPCVEEGSNVAGVSHLIAHRMAEEFASCIITRLVDDGGPDVA